MTAAHTYTQAGNSPASPSCKITVCQHCGDTEVCMPVQGRYSSRAYWYCVERCLPAARIANERASTDRAICDCCGEWTTVRRVRLASGLLNLRYCPACHSPELLHLTALPQCTRCGERLRPHQYERGFCGGCW